LLKYSVKIVGDRFERIGAMASQIPKSVRWSCNANFKLMVIKREEETNNCATARKFGVAEPNVRRWRKQKELLKGASSTRKAFRGPKHGNFNAVDEKVLEFVLEKRKNGLPVTRETIRMKALEIATSLKIQRQDFKASNGWVARFMCRKGLALHWRTTLAKKLPTDYVEKLIAYQHHIINLRRKHDYLSGRMGNTDETPVFFDMLANTAVDSKGSKSVLVKTTGHEKQNNCDAFSSG
jgi:transposase-like protein